MTSKKTIIFFTLILFLSTTSHILSQNKTNTIKYFQFELSDSSTVVGSIVFENESVVQIKNTSNEEIRISKQNILNKKRVYINIQTNVYSDSTTISENIGSIAEQTDSTIVRLELIGGSTLIGRVASEDSTSITINLLSNTTTTIKKKSIEKRETIEKNLYNGQYWIDDPNSTRLFFAPTGRGLVSGNGYVSVYEIFFPMVAFGIADYITIAGGISLFPGLSKQLLYFAPKITPFQNDKFAVSIGDFYVRTPSNNRNNDINIIYSIGTVSFSKGAITMGVGYETKSENPIILLGGELRVSKYAKLITENWFLGGSDLKFVSLGIRILGKYLAADFAFVTPIGDNNTIFMPWIGFAYNF